MSQLIDCPHVLHVCGDLSYFSDAVCTTGALLFTEGFVCDECSTREGKLSAQCAADNDERQVLMLSSCSRSDCRSCEPQLNITAGSCYPSREVHQSSLVPSTFKNRLQQLQARSFRYTGAVVCSVVNIKQYGSLNCAGGALDNWLPQNSCVKGGRVSCRNAK
jgi:hypothetical protein